MTLFFVLGMFLVQCSSERIVHVGSGSDVVVTFTLTDKEALQSVWFEAGGETFQVSREELEAASVVIPLYSSFDFDADGKLLY